MKTPLSQVCDLIANAIGIDPVKIDMDSSTDNTEEWDSVAIMSIVVSLEEAFSTSLSAEEMVAITSVENILSILETRGVSC